MSQYTAGTVQVVNADATITGTGTLWVANVAAGQTFMISGSSVPYIIASVTDDTHLELTANYAGASVSGLDYEINTSRTPALGIDYIERGDIDTATTFKRAMLQIETLLTAVGAVPISSGTWTPVITFNTPGNLSVAYALRIGRWQRVGNRIILDFLIQTSTFTHTTAANRMEITGVPFAALTLANFEMYGALGEFQGITKANYTQFMLRILSSESKLCIVAGGSAQPSYTIGAAEMPTGGTVYLAGTIIYEIAP